MKKSELNNLYLTGVTKIISFKYERKINKEKINNNLIPRGIDFCFELNSEKMFDIFLD